MLEDKACLQETLGGETGTVDLCVGTATGRMDITPGSITVYPGSGRDNYSAN